MSTVIPSSPSVVTLVDMVERALEEACEPHPAGRGLVGVVCSRTQPGGGTCPFEDECENLDPDEDCLLFGFNNDEI